MALGKSFTLADTLATKGVSRRDFLKFCAAMTAALALPMKYTDRVAAAVASAKKPVLVWLEFQDCAGNSESLLRASAPSVSEIVLDVLSLDYHETVMAAAGHQAEEALKMATAEPGSYLAVVEGSIPTRDGGVYCTVGGRTAMDIATEVCGSALATITCGTCSAFGGLPAASPNPTGAVSVQEAVPGATVINLPGCPMNVANLTATVVHYLTFNSLPATDQFGRPLFAYGSRIHDDCERRAHLTPVNLCGNGATKDTAPAGVCTTWVAKGRPLTTTALWYAGTMAQAGPSARDTAVWAALNRPFGIR